jgi:hypothetical protein
MNLIQNEQFQFFSIPIIESEDGRYWYYAPWQSSQYMIPDQQETCRNNKKFIFEAHNYMFF